MLAVIALIASQGRFRPSQVFGEHSRALAARGIGQGRQLLTVEDRLPSWASGGRQRTLCGTTYRATLPVSREN